MFGNVNNRIMERYKQPEPMQGMAATLIFFSDRHAATITEVHDLTGVIVVQQDKATRTDERGQCDSQDYTYERDPAGAKYVFKRDTKGRWKQVAYNKATKRYKQSGTTTLRIGERDEHYDFSF